MKLAEYKTRLVIVNLLIYIITWFFVLFAVLQSTWYYSVTRLENDMLQTSTNLNIYIQEKTAHLQNDDARATYLFSNSTDIYNVVMNYSNCTLELFNYDGLLLVYDSNNQEPTYMTQEYATCIARNQPVMSIRNNNGVKQLWVMAPILTKTSAIIGFAGMINPLNEAENLQWFLFALISVCGLVGLLVVFLASAQFSDSFIKPIQTLTKISDEINKGDYNQIITYKKNDEIGELTRVYNEMTQNINTVFNQLKNERQSLGDILASLDDGVIALTREGTLLTSNRYIKTYFDIIDPKTIEDFSEYEFFQEIFNSLREGKANVSKEVLINGRNLLIIGSPIKTSGIEENYLIIIRNITNEKLLEEEQRKFISSVSHELRTPLTTIIGYTDMLNRRQINDQKLLSSSLNTINKEGHRLVRLVDDLLNAHSLQDMSFSFYMEELDLNELVTDVVRQMRVKSISKEIEIQYKAVNDIPMIEGDYDRLSQIFINIIHNAIKFSSKGGVIDVVLTVEDEYLSVSIRDYGIGIDPAKKDFIFSAFYRVDEDRARHEGEGGAGLGLYIVKQIVDKHNGKISVDSELEEGTNITVKLPFKKEQEEDNSEN